MITNIHIGYDGRLGNQLFQFAAVFGVAKRNGYDFVIPRSNTAPMSGFTMDGKPCTYRLEIADCFDIEHLLGEPFGLRQLVKERHFHFDESIMESPDNSSLNGYFQTDKYFREFKEDLLDTLKFKPHVVELAKSVLPTTNETLVSLHVRRGDYLHPNPHHPVIGTEYFDTAVSKFDGACRFLVFSDDPEWCRTTWQGDDRFTVVETGNNLVDLCAMSMCEHNIITNSSFSWWASYLNRNPEKTVIAPAKWFGPGYANYDLGDLYTDFMKTI